MIRSKTLQILILSNLLAIINCDTQLEDIFANCRISKPDFEECLKFAFNQLNPLFPKGIPELNVSPFDPHRQSYIEQNRGNDRALAGYKLVLKDVGEYGWTQSWVTKLRINWEDQALIYSQQFPEKSLDGKYVFESKIIGQPLKNTGNWSLVLTDYSQTTTVKRIGGPGGRLKVRVVIDKIGGMKLHISDLFRGATVIESIADFIINTTWQPFLPFIKPLIEDLVSTAFTDIFNESFRYFPIERFIKY